MDALSARLPGLQPVAEGDWLRVDDAYAAQMAYRDQLLNDRTSDVFMRHGYSRCGGDVVAGEGRGGGARPGRDLRALPVASDGQTVVVIDPAREASPMIAAARLAQEDFLDSGARPRRGMCWYLPSCAFRPAGRCTRRSGATWRAFTSRWIAMTTTSPGA